MRRAFLCFLLLSGTLAAQPAAPLSKLNETLHAMARAGASSVSLSAQLVDEMMSLAPSDSQPSRGALAGFANDSTTALIGKYLNDSRVTTLQRCIADVLSGSGTNSKPAKLLRDTLTAMGVATSRIPSYHYTFLSPSGEEVRGPGRYSGVPPQQSMSQSAIEIAVVRNPPDNRANSATRAIPRSE